LPIFAVSKSTSLFLSSQIHFIFEDTRHLILKDLETQRVVIAKITHLLTIECDGRAQPWLELKLGELASFRDGFLEFQCATILPSIQMEQVDHCQAHPPHAAMKQCGLQQSEVAHQQ
jgi:hypothetical protein